jgi:hypothetical protein
VARSLSEYVALALIRKIEVEQGFYTSPKHQDFSGDFEQLSELAASRCGFTVSDDTLRGAVRVLSDWKLVRVTDDSYSGTFYKIWSERDEGALSAGREELSSASGDGLDNKDIVSRRSDYPLASALIEHEVFEDYGDHGEVWLTRALEGLKRRIEAGEFDLEYQFKSLLENSAPASDRVVRLTDNQVNELDSDITKLIDEVSDRNEVGGHVGLRELIVGQLKAGRELFRSGSVRVYLVHATLVEILKFMAKRYEHEAIGALASALLTALFNHFGLI